MGGVLDRCQNFRPLHQRTLSLHKSDWSPVMNLPSIHRVVTGHDASGKAIVSMNGPHWAPASGLWTSRPTPTSCWAVAPTT